MRKLLIAITPIAPVLHYFFKINPLFVFGAGIAGVAVSADWIRRGTDELALHTGPSIGGLLTVSLGSLAELLLATLVLIGGHREVVHAQITGSIIGTGLLGLGLAMIAGGLKHDRQQFKRERAGLLSSLLMLSAVALMLPAVVDYTGRAVRGDAHMGANDEWLSVAVSGVLLSLYAGNLVFTLITHRDVFASGEADQEKPSWSLWLCFAVLVAATLGAAIESEMVSQTLNATAASLGLSQIFLGVVILALIGTISDLFAAIYFAREDRMGLVMTICIGSAIQMVMVIAPLLVLISLAIGHRLTLVFKNPLFLFVIAGGVLIVNTIAGDGETTWFEGMLLVGVYVVFGLAFFFL